MEEIPAISKLNKKEILLNDESLEMNVPISRKKSWVCMNFWLKLELSYFDEKFEN